MMTAKPDCCQEAAILPAGMADAYFPCNKPATKVVGWRGRSDQPLLMCAMCAHHNIRNRGGYEVSLYPPAEVVTPKAVPLRTCKPVQKTDYPADVVQQYEGRLSKSYFAILIAAAASENYDQIAARVGATSTGTVKSRLNRARKAIAGLIPVAKEY